jgi:hypothetical protein
MTGVVESWLHNMGATDVVPAAAACWALIETVGADAVETVSPAEARTSPITVNELVVALESTTENVAVDGPSVTVRWEID